jgi:hypothetical protein
LSPRMALGETTLAFSLCAAWRPEKRIAIVFLPA